ncbi:hypothetical protein EMIT0P258_20406 [Pseudomonas sp. IT-P258]
MAAEQDRFSRVFSFILYNETKLFPVKIKRRDTGVVAYRISRGGTAGNTQEAGEEADEAICGSLRFARRKDQRPIKTRPQVCTRGASKGSLTFKMFTFFNGSLHISGFPPQAQ